MRLSQRQVALIKEGASDIYGESNKVLLFGSRVDDSKKGGDIDLLIELENKELDQFEKQLKLNGRLQRQLGEQKIDIVTYVKGSKQSALHQSAYKMGQYL